MTREIDPLLQACRKAICKRYGAQAEVAFSSNTEATAQGLWRKARALLNPAEQQMLVHFFDRDEPGVGRSHSPEEVADLVEALLGGCLMSELGTLSDAQAIRGAFDILLQVSFRLAKKAWGEHVQRQATPDMLAGALMAPDRTVREWALEALATLQATPLIAVPEDTHAII